MWKLEFVCDFEFGHWTLAIEFVHSVIEASYSLDEVCPYRFPHPLAPLVAANIAGEKIDLERIKSCFYNLSSIHDTVIVEGAGGLLVPILGILPFDLGICVEEGRIGKLREIASASFTSELGGSFNVEEFLSKLK